MPGIGVGVALGRARRIGVPLPNPTTTRANSTAVRANHGNFAVQLLSIQQQIAAFGG